MLSAFARAVVARLEALGALRREQDATALNTQVLERITDAFFALDDEWRFTYVNQEAEQLLERPKEQLLGKSLWEEFPEIVGSTFYREYHRAMAEQVKVEFEEFYPPLDTWFGVRTYPSEEGLSVYFQDISERKQVEERLRLRDRAVTASANGILITDSSRPDNPVVYANPAFERMTGYAAEEVIGHNCRFLQGSDRDQPARHDLRTAVREGREYTGVLRNYRKDGTLFWNAVRDARLLRGGTALSNLQGHHLP